jgi:uncharacterized protein YkwD
VLVPALLLPAGAARAQRSCSSGETTTAQVVCLINAERAERGLSLLRRNAALERAAAGHAQDMVRHGYLSHNSRSGSTPEQRAARAGYRRTGPQWIVAENLGFTTGVRDPGFIMRAWLGSRVHRENLLGRRFRDVGVGIAPASPFGDAIGLTVVVKFGGQSVGRILGGKDRRRARARRRRR